MHNIYTILDIGTARVLCIIAKISNTDTPEILGIGCSTSQGINSGSITDIAKASASLEITIRDAEQMAECKAQNIYLTLSGYNTFSIHKEIEIITENGTVSQKDMQQLTRKSLIIEQNGIFILHCIPISYKIDGLNGINNPIGMKGKKLSAKFHIIASYKSRLQNISQCLTQFSIHTNKCIASAYSVSIACLNQNELELGSVVLDIGAKSTTISMHQDNCIIHTDYVPIGGMHITKDLSCGLSISTEHAEKVKKLYGSVYNKTEDASELIQISNLMNNQKNILVPKPAINNIIRARMEEIFELALEKINKAPVNASPSQRMILVGGCSKLLNIPKLATRIMHSEARLGSVTTKINGIETQDLSHIGAVGAIMFIKQKLETPPKKKIATNEGAIENLWKWIKKTVTAQ